MILSEIRQWTKKLPTSERLETNDTTTQTTTNSVFPLDIAIFQFIVKIVLRNNFCIAITLLSLNYTDAMRSYSTLTINIRLLYLATLIIKIIISS